MLSANFDVMGVALVMCDSLPNASSAQSDRRQLLAESWVQRSWEAVSIDTLGTH